MTSLVTRKNPKWLSVHAPDCVSLHVHIQPGAKKSEVAGVHGDRLKIRVAAPPVDGKANAALVSFLAGILDLPKSRIEISAGATGRKKTLIVSHIYPDQVLTVLTPLASG